MHRIKHVHLALIIMEEIVLSVILKRSVRDALLECLLKMVNAPTVCQGAKNVLEEIAMNVIRILQW
jgi:hypothetical protein